MEQDTISLTGGAKYKNYPFYGMTSGLGIQSEHIQFVGFVTSIGMAAFSPFFYQLVCIRREKIMCIVGFSIMYLLSYVCAVTDSIFVLALCSLVMGFLRMELMMVNLFTLIRYAFGMEATRNITPYRGRMGLFGCGKEQKYAYYLFVLYDFRTGRHVTHGMVGL